MKIRKAQIKDVPTIHKLLQYYSDKGELLGRALSKLYDHLRDFSVYEDEDGEVVACCALSICWKDLAEIRSLAVAPELTRRGIGTHLTNNAIEEASGFGVEEIFALTYRPAFFERFGFTVIPRSDLPIKIWGDCLHCVKYPDCDEIAMLKRLSS